MLCLSLALPPASPCRLVVKFRPSRQALEAAAAAVSARRNRSRGPHHPHSHGYAHDSAPAGDLVVDELCSVLNFLSTSMPPGGSVMKGLAQYRQYTDGLANSTGMDAPGADDWACGADTRNSNASSGSGESLSNSASTLSAATSSSMSANDMVMVISAGGPRKGANTAAPPKAALLGSGLSRASSLDTYSPRAATVDAFGDLRGDLSGSPMLSEGDELGGDEESGGDVPEGRPSRHLWLGNIPLKPNKAAMEALFR